MNKTAEAPSVVRRSLLSWVLLRDNRKHQLLLLGIVIVTVGMRLVPLEMQKRIVDEGILGKDVRLLAIYCAIYLVTFLSASALKYGINALQTIIGQRTLARMRREMFGHIVHLPYGFFRNTQSGAVIATLLSELATAGDFIGLAVAVPATNLLTLGAFGVYLFLLNPLLAVVSFSIYPVVVLVVPFLQRRVNHYNRKRVNATRRVSGKIGEVVDGLHEIKTGNAYDHEERRFARLVDRLCHIRIVWNLYRFAVKVTNNLLINFSRFLIFALGGYLALEGNLAIGSLVAFLSAQEKLYDPWKEMIRYYQAYQTAAVTYRRAMRTYDAIPEPLTAGEGDGGQPLSGDVVIEHAGYRTRRGATLLRDISLELPAGGHLALVGPSGSGKSTLAHCIVGLMPPSEGQIRIGGRDNTELSRATLSRTIAFVPQAPFVFRGTIADNLVYPDDSSAQEDRQPSSQACGAQENLHATIEVIQQVGLFVDVLGFGLDNRLGRNACEDLRAAIVASRRRLDEAMEDDLAEHVERFDREAFLHHASLGENLLFGRVLHQETLGPRHLGTHPEVDALLTEAGLKGALFDLGMTILEEMAPHLRHPPIPEDLQRLLPLDMEQIRRGLNLLQRRSRKPQRPALGAAEEEMLLSLALAFIPCKAPHVEIPPDLTEGIVGLRSKIQERLRRREPEAVSFYQWDRYIEDATILNNILFGRVTTDHEDTRHRIRKAIHRVLIEKELLETIVDIGLQHQVGTAGKNLSGGQRQKLAIARALLKQPPVLVFDEATASLDQASQARVQDILVQHWKGRSTLIAVIHRLDVLHNYDQVAVMQDGRLVEAGAYDDLMAQKGLLHALVNEGATASRG